VPTFELNLKDLEADLGKEIPVYKEGIKSILRRLGERVKSGSYPSALDELLKKLEINIEKGIDIFDSECLDIEKHPQLWTKTNRVRSSTITVTVENSSKKLSTYEELNKLFINYLKKTSRFNSIDKQNRLDINRALDELQQWQADAISAYIRRLRDRTADALMEQLNEISSAENTEEINSYLKTIRAIKELDTNNLRTSAACLENNQKVNTLRNDLLKFSKKNSDLTLAHLAEQLSVVTKRWIDPFYENPRELTKIEKARKIGKMIIINLAEILAVTAFILFFVFPPASFPVGVAAAIGMLPIFDGLFEIARNIWYGRSPTVEQVREVGIALFIVVGLTFCAYGVAVIGLSIMQNATNVATKMVNFGRFMATIAMRYIDVVLNTMGSTFDAFQFSKSMQLETEEQLNNRHKPISSKKLMKFFHDQATYLQQKKIIIETPDALRKQAPKAGKVGYICKTANDSYIFQKSSTEKISHWPKGYHRFPFTNNEVSEIERAIKNYSLLTIHAETKQRLEEIKKIKTAINNWKMSSNFRTITQHSRVTKLEKQVVKEERTLNEIEKQGLKSPYLSRHVRI
jgi:hypothetical protein